MDRLEYRPEVDKYTYYFEHSGFRFEIGSLKDVIELVSDLYYASGGSEIKTQVDERVFVDFEKMYCMDADPWINPTFKKNDYIGNAERMLRTIMEYLYRMIPENVREPRL